MSQTLRLTGKATVTPASGGTKQTIVLPNLSLTIGDNEEGAVRNIGTSEETFAINTDIGDAGYLILTNETASGSSGSCEVGIATGSYFVQLAPQEWAIVPIAEGTTTLYLQSDTATQTIRIHLFERS